MDDVLDVFSEISTGQFFVNQMKDTGQWFDKDLVESAIPERVLRLIPKNMVEEYSVLPAIIDEKMVLVTSSDRAFKQVDKFASLLGQPVRLLLGDESNVRNGARHYYGVTLSRTKLEDVTVGLDKKDEENGTLSEAERPQVVKKVESMIFSAIGKNASDINILPQSKGCYVTFKVDGHLSDVSEEYVFGVDVIDAVPGIIKNMCMPKITKNSRQVGDGSLKINYGNELVDIRVSTMPLPVGQGINLRVLQGGKEIRKLNTLGYSKREITAIRDALLSSRGLFLVAGPTGAGKSTTLYAQIYDVIERRNEPLKVITIENPIEYRDENFFQVQVHEAASDDLSLTARKIFIASLRQNPDIILYGEIRDKGDGEVAVEAATTGHRVFSTVHAGDCVSAIRRLLDLGVTKSSLLAELKIIVSQRLVGEICPHCSETYTINIGDSKVLTKEDVEYLNEGQPRKLKMKREREFSPCPNHCNNGYLGRTVVVEYVVFDTKLRDSLLLATTFSEIEEELKRREFESMWQKGLKLVKDGRVSLKELVDVVWDQ